MSRRKEKDQESPFRLKKFEMPIRQPDGDVE